MIMVVDGIAADVGGRITVLLTMIPDLGPGTLKSREDPNQRAASSPFEALDNPFSNRVHSFLRKLSVCRTVFAPVILIREDSPLRSLFSGRLIDDRTESSHSYIEFLSYIRQEIRK
ncbi:Protein transport protein [Dirofilaria immitis]